jgi:hypothetical protein
MNRKFWVSLLAVGIASAVMADVRGTAPRSSADKYRTHAERDGLAMGAELLTASQTHKVFTSDVNRCCLVVEVAFYPPKNKPLSVSLDDFTLQAAGNENAVKPLSARAVASTIQDRNQHTREVVTTQSVGVGYESGTVIDPVTGQPTKVHGVTTQAGVGVGVGDGGSAPVSTNRDREVMETELREKGLPEGDTAAPVSGYLYFPISAKKKNSALQLKYSLGDQPVVFSFPQ